MVHNSTKQREAKPCELHNETMKKRLVGTQFGKYRLPNVDPRFPNAKMKKNMGCLKGPWPNKRLAIVYHCKSCTKAKKIAN